MYCYEIFDQKPRSTTEPIHFGALRKPKIGDEYDSARAKLRKWCASNPGRTFWMQVGQGAGGRVHCIYEELRDLSAKRD